MVLRKEEKQKSLCLKKDFKNKVKEIEGKILLVLFIAMLILLGEVSPRIAQFILMIELEDMILIVKSILYITSILGVLSTIKQQMRKEIEDVRDIYKNH